MNASWKFTNGLLGFVVLLLVSVSACFAQSTSTLAGTVTDPTGAVVAGASVKVRSLSTNVLRETVSDSAGAYVVPSLQPGDYEIRTTAAGFGSNVIKSVTLQVDQSVTANVKLNVESAGETVQVEAGAAPIIDSQTITMGQVIDKDTVQNIPLNGRHFLDLTNLTPGAVVPPANGFLTGTSRGLGANSFITGGAREDANNFQINGINLNDMTQNQITFQPSINTTSEFKIINSTFGAEYGRSSGSVVNVATRSGASSYHGEAFDYLRNNYFDARNYFNRKGTRQNQFIRNNFGGAFSGPLPFILKDKAFLFLSYEGLRQTQALLLTSNVPTLTQRTAFANSPAGAAYARLITLIPVGVETTTIDPKTGLPVTTAVASGSSPGPVKTDQYSGDGLFNISAANSLHLYYAWQQDARTEPNLQGNTIAGFGDHRTAHRQIGTINDVHIFSPSVVNEARFGFNRIAINFADSFTAVSSDYGIPNGVTAAIGLPQISVTDLGLNFGGPSGFPQGRFVTTGVFSDTVNYLKSKHSFKFGGEFRRFEGNNFSNTAGTVNYTTTANFINGLTNTYSANSINPVSNRIFISAVAAFAEDTYKVTPTLTLEYGLRYEWNGTPAEGGHRFITFNPATSAFQQVNQPYKQNNNYEPRLGFIYDISGKGKTTVRGGFGYLVDQPIISNVTGLASNPPLSNPLAINGAPIGTAFASAAASSLAPSSVNPNFKNGYIESYNLNVQQELGPSSALQVGYIGSQGRHLRLNHNINQFVYATPTTATGTRPFPTAKMLDGTTRPLGNITYNDSIGMSNYNALWVTYRRSLRGGLAFNTTYTYSKSMDENSQSGNGIQDNTNPAGSYGLSDFDVRHHFVFSGTWTLPFHGNRLKDGWLLADVTQIQGGNPLNVVTGSAYSGATGNIRPTLLARPSTGIHKALGNFSIPFIVGTSCLTATPGCNFLAPTLGYGSMQRNGLTGPGFSDTDVSLQKTTKIAESVNFILRMDAFDVFNQANFGNPNLTASTTSTSFGTITATRGAIGDAGSSRQLQFAAKVQF
jgi:hypothetical protein